MATIMKIYEKQTDRVDFELVDDQIMCLHGTDQALINIKIEDQLEKYNVKHDLFVEGMVTCRRRVPYLLNVVPNNDIFIGQVDNGKTIIMDGNEVKILLYN